MSLNKYIHHHTEAYFILSIFVSMSRSSSDYPASMWFIFPFQRHFHVSNHITSFKQMYMYFVHFWEYLLLFFKDSVNEESEFSSSKSSAPSVACPRCCCCFACFFANFSLTLPIKVLLIKKACVLGSHQADSDASYWSHTLWKHLILTTAYYWDKNQSSMDCWNHH